jgi:hypothetical protein
MHLDRNRPSSLGVLMVQDRDPASHVYEINTWLWNWPQPLLGGLSITKTERISRECRSESSRRAAETRKAKKRAADEI